MATDRRLDLMGDDAQKRRDATMPMRMDSHKWIRRLRLPYWRVATLREMRVGEVFWVGCFDGPGIIESCLGRCEAYIERVRGGYRFAAVWTMQWTGKSDRPHIMTDGRFNLLKGNIVEFPTARDWEAELNFQRVCRYVEYIVRHSKSYGFDEMYYREHHLHAMWRGELVHANGCTRWGVEGPEPRGLGAIVDVAIAIGAVPNPMQAA